MSGEIDERYQVPILANWVPITTGKQLELPVSRAFVGPSCGGDGGYDAKEPAQGHVRLRLYGEEITAIREQNCRDRPELLAFRSEVFRT